MNHSTFFNGWFSLLPFSSLFSGETFNASNIFWQSTNQINEEPKISDTNGIKEPIVNLVLEWAMYYGGIDGNIGRYMAKVPDGNIFIAAHYG